MLLVSNLSLLLFSSRSKKSLMTSAFFPFVSGGSLTLPVWSGYVAFILQALAN